MESMWLPYNRKYWRSIKFGGLVVGETTVNIKSVKFFNELYANKKTRNFVLSKPRPTLHHLHSCVRASRYSEIEDRDSWLNSHQHLLADGCTQIPDERKKRTSWQVYVLLKILQEFVNTQSSCFRTCVAALASHVICRYARARTLYVRPGTR